MSYTADALIRDLINAEDGEDVVVLVEGRCFLITGVSPQRDRGCLVLNTNEIHKETP